MRFIISRSLKLFTVTQHRLSRSGFATLQLLLHHNPQVSGSNP